MAFFFCLASNRGTASPHSPEEKPYPSSLLPILTRSGASVPRCRLEHITQKHRAMCQEMQTISCLPFVRTGSRLPLLRLQPWLLALYSPPLTHTHTHRANPQPCRATAAPPQPVSSVRSSARSVAQRARVRAHRRSTGYRGAREEGCQIGSQISSATIAQRSLNEKSTIKHLKHALKKTECVVG